MRSLFSVIALTSLLSACASTDKPFMPRSDYPPDPYVKGYADPDDCLGGEKLAAIDFALPDYPRRMWSGGRQGWTIIRLDVAESGETENVRIERSVPGGAFSSASVSAVKDWRFQPPEDGALKNCRVLIRYRLGEVTLGG